MIIINTIDSQKFSFNGVNYLKNFTPIVSGSKIEIVNTYDSKIKLTDFPTSFDQFEVNGNTFANVALLQDALLTVIFTRSSLGVGGVQSVVAGTNVTVDNTDPLNPIVSATGGSGTGTKIFSLSIPKVTITRSATPLYYAQGLSGSIILNNSTGLSDGSVLSSIGGITTTLFCVPYDCKLQIVSAHLNALDFDLSIWKSDNFMNPTTNAVRIFQANTTTGLIQNFSVASIDLQQGNLIQPFVKINTGSGGTNLGEIFLTFETI